MRYCRLPCAALVVLVGACVHAAGAHGAAVAATHDAHRVAVTVTEPDGVEHRAWPLTFSVPWPQGMLHDESVSVSDRSGAHLPVQARALRKWPDGSIRWLLVDTQLTLAPHETKHISLTRGPATVTGPSQLHVDDNEQRIAVDTGALRFGIPRHRFAIAEQIEASGRTQSGPITAVLQREQTAVSAAAPQHVRILERGPLRTRIELDGEYDAGFAYVIRVEAYAGHPFIRVLHTFINRDPADTVRVPRITLDWPVRTAVPAVYGAGVDSGAAHAGTLTDDGVRFVQVDNETWRLGDEVRPGKLAGWFNVGVGDHAVGLAARWFWQQYPQSVIVTPQHIAYNLWAPEVEPARVGMGAAKTHEVVFWVGDARRAALTTAARPLVAVVDAAWIAQTGALPQAIAAEPHSHRFLQSVRAAFDRYMQRNAIERWDDRGTVQCDGVFGEQPRTGAYGMWNWGDWNFPKYHDQTKGCDAWGNLEYDATQVLALGFAATGDVQMHDAMVAAARHFMDVDTIHYQRRHPDWIGMNHPKNPLHFSFELGGIDLGHTWTEGLLSYYYLTGDERGLAGARSIADYLVQRSRGILALANPRQLGWPQIALLAVYDATGETTYLDAARVYAKRALELFKPDQVSHWKHGILADALAYTHRATHDPAVEQWLRTYAHTVAQLPRPSDPRFIPGVAYVARLTHDARLRSFATNGVQQIDLGGWGKPFTLGGRLGFRVYSLLAERETAPQPPKRHAPAPAKRRAHK